MNNPLLSLMTQNPAILPIKNMIKMLNGQNNPMQIIQAVARQNPQMGQIMNMINQSGMSPKQLFMAQAQKMGVNPNDIINQLK